MFSPFQREMLICQDDDNFVSSRETTKRTRN